MGIYLGESQILVNHNKQLCNINLFTSPPLPSIYQEVEYIKSADNSGAYIDLGFAFDKKARIEMALYFTDTTATGYPFGATENSGVLRCCLSMPYSANGYGTFYGSTGSIYNGVSNLQYESNAKSEFLFTLEKGLLFGKNITTGVESKTTTQGEYTMTNNLYLLAQNYNGSPRFGSARQVYYFKYYDKNDTLICDLVPCYRKSDGVIGMYDVVRKLFLTNVGSGSFIKGNDVTE